MSRKRRRKRERRGRRKDKGQVEDEGEIEGASRGGMRHHLVPLNNNSHVPTGSETV